MFALFHHLLHFLLIIRFLHSYYQFWLCGHFSSAAHLYWLLVHIHYYYYCVHTIPMMSAWSLSTRTPPSTTLSVDSVFPSLCPRAAENRCDKSYTCRFSSDIYRWYVCMPPLFVPWQFREQQSKSTINQHTLLPFKSRASIAQHLPAPPTLHFPIYAHSNDPNREEDNGSHNTQQSEMRRTRDVSSRLYALHSRMVGR